MISESEYFWTGLFAVLLVILTIIIKIVFKSKPNLVLLTGLSDSGKTALFSKLVFNKAKNSVTSLRENEASISELNLRLVDLPGTERLRGKFWEQYRTNAKHVVFILDSTTVDSKLRDLSEYLYTLLSDRIIHEKRVKFIIACNKQDLDDAKSKDEIQLVIERELNAIRATKNGQLSKTSNEQDEDYLAHLDAEKISLDALKVKLTETSVHNPEHLIKSILN